MLNRLMFLFLLIILVGCNSTQVSADIEFAGCSWPQPPQHQRNDVDRNIFFRKMPEENSPMTKVSFKLNDETIQLGAEIRKYIRNINISEVDDYIVSQFEYSDSEEFKNLEGYKMAIIQNKNTLESVEFYNIDHQFYFDKCLKSKDDGISETTTLE